MNGAWFQIFLVGNGGTEFQLANHIAGYVGPGSICNHVHVGSIGVSRYKFSEHVAGKDGIWFHFTSIELHIYTVGSNTYSFSHSSAAAVTVLLAVLRVLLNLTHDN